MESVDKQVVPEHLSHFVADHINLVGRLAILGLFIAWPQLDQRYISIYIYIYICIYVYMYICI